MGFAQAGTAHHDGDSLAIAGVKPSGMAAQGKVFWQATQWKLLAIASGSPVTLDTTGANLIVIVGYTWNTVLTASDSLGNVWTFENPQAYASVTEFAYCIHPAVGSGHVFTLGSASAVLAFKAPATVAFDQMSSGPDYGWQSSCQSPPLTPTGVPALFVTGVCGNDGNGVVTGVDSGFTIVDQAAAYLNSTAWRVQPASAALSPTWTFNEASQYSQSSQLCFKP